MMAEKTGADPQPLDVPDVSGQNWNDLAQHLQVKVHKRTGEVAHLHTKAGFLIAAAVIVLQIIIGLGSMNLCMTIAQATAALLSIASLVLSIISMHVSKSPTPLNPDEMILTLTEGTDMSRATFGKWLARSYAAANTEFNKLYNKKYMQQIIAASLLVAAVIIAIILKGVSYHV